jgi:hypothetical protein
MSAVAAGNSKGASSSPDGRAIAAIDVGSSSVRLCIAQAGSDGSYTPLETLTVPVRLGADTFTKGRLGPQGIRAACEALAGFAEAGKSKGTGYFFWNMGKDGKPDPWAGEGGELSAYAAEAPSHC